jgi:hypothetical protein
MHLMRRYFTIILPLLLNAGEAGAATYCSLGKPTMDKAGGQVHLNVTVTCSDIEHGAAVKYPEGDLYVGATLYTIDDPSLSGKVAPFTLKSADSAGAHDLAAVGLHTSPGMTKVTLVVDTPTPASYTHLLVAVWDAKNTCSPGDTTTAYGCPGSGYTLGRMDKWEMPIPIDAWPRPICDRKRLIARGYFKWVDQDGDPSGHAIPAELESAFDANDCWSLDDGGGLGFSLRQWRVGPLPKPPA